MDPNEANWVAQRTEAARVQQGRLQARKNAEHEKAEAIIAQQWPIIRQRGPAPVKLEVQGYGGVGRARTNLTGWYLRKNRTVALGTDGKFYVLIAPLSTMDRIRGLKPQPTRPPLIIGEGGKDGETIDLKDALERVYNPSKFA